MNFGIGWVLLGCLGWISSAAHAVPSETLFEPAQESKFINTDCKSNNTCSLKSFKMSITQYQVKFFEKEGTSTSYGTKMTASYETDKNSNLEKYGIAQFIQGCQFMSKIENGKVTRYPAIAREFMGKYIRYLHPKMEIDGFVPDPLSWSYDPKLSRHYSYYNKNPSQRDIVHDDYYGAKPPTESKLYVQDRPGVASFYADSTRAYNVSLKFKTCIYRSADVPTVVDSKNLNFAQPIHCFDWASSYIYNFELGKFETLPEIDPYCLSDASKDIDL